jgi:hypothetical protein
MALPAASLAGSDRAISCALDRGLPRSIHAFPQTQAVVKRAGTRWRALGCLIVNNKTGSQSASVEIDVGKGTRWVSEGIIPIPLGGLWNSLHAASLTHSGVPDFVASAGGGADWLPLAVVARLRGRWQLARFDAPALLRTSFVVQSQAPVRFGLVHSTADACGCAAGPITSIWYRFNGSLFVPAPAPGGAANCTALTLSRAHVLPGDPGYLGSRKWRFAPFRVTRFACLDGWALAENDAGRYALFNQQDPKQWNRSTRQAGQWYRACTGPFAVLLQTARYFALPADLLTQLRQRLRP